MVENEGSRRPQISVLAVAWSRTHCGHVTTTRFPGLQERALILIKEEIGRLAYRINDERIAVKALEDDRTLDAKTI